MIKKYLGATLVGLSLLAASSSSSAKVIDFEDINFSPSGGFSGQDLTQRYGLNFTGGRYGFSTLTATSYSGWGAHSGNNYAWGDGYNMGIEISGNNITLNSFWVRGALMADDVGSITVRAFKGSKAVASKEFSYTETYHLETFNFAGIDRILITSRGSGPVLLDDIDVGFASPVPEPASYAMLLGGLSLLMLAARRRKSS